MTYMDNPCPAPRPRTLERRPAGWLPDRDLAVVCGVVTEFPSYGVDEVATEARRRGATVTRDFVRAAMEA